MAKQKNPRRPRFRFSDVSITDGETLSSRYDASVKCTVVRDGYVRFKRQEMTFTEATKQMFRRVRDPLPKWFPRGLQPSRHWKHQRRLLVETYEEKYPREEERRREDGWQAGEEDIPEKGAPEGAVRQRRVNWYERDPKNRKAAIKKHGMRCLGCDLKMEERYGKIAKGFIHVHHAKPLSTVPEDYQPDIDDLLPLCPNCHAVVHLGEQKSRKKRPLTIKELQARIRKDQKSS